MKNISIIILSFLSLFSCENKTNCNASVPIEKTHILKINDKAPSFYPIGTNKLSFLDLKKDLTIIFFKSETDDIQEGYNQEINRPKIWKTLEKNNIDIVVISNLKVASNYGVEITNDRIKTNYLFIINQHKVIKNIYSNICILDINKIIIN